MTFTVRGTGLTKLYRLFPRIRLPVKLIFAGIVHAKSSQHVFYFNVSLTCWHFDPFLSEILDSSISRDKLRKHFNDFRKTINSCSSYGAAVRCSQLNIK